MAFVSDFATEDSGVFSLSVNGFVPRTAIIPLVQDAAKNPTVLVKAGDTVREGQSIAQSTYGTVHATIPGTVSAVAVVQYPNGKQGKAAHIALGGAFSYTGKPRKTVDWHTYDTNTIQIIFSEKGVVNTYKEPIALTEQIKNLHPKSARMLAVRLFDDDPSRVTERFLAAQYATDIVQGAAIIAKAMQATGIVFAYAAHKPNPVEQALASSATIPTTACPVEAVKYPCGTMHEIVAAVKKQHKDAPFASLGNRDIFIDVQTALAAYNAVARSTPVLETFVHVTGECLNAAAIIKVKIGTTLEELAMQCGGFKRKVAKIVVNGIATGTAVSSLSIPVTKAVKSVTFLPSKSAHRQYAEHCVRCGACRKICPVGLYPDIVYRSFIHGADRTELETGFAQTRILCTACGLCDAVCPSRLPLRKTIALVTETQEPHKEVLHEK